MANIVFLSFGSNLEDREANIIRAVEMVEKLEGFEAIASSPLYISPAVGIKPPAPDFLNMVIKGEYIYTPLELLNSIELIEKKLRRTGKGKMKPRTIDIDILLFGQEIIETERLSVPHRKLTERAFVLVPLLQIEPDLVHPVTGELLASYVREKDARELTMYKETVRRHAGT